MQPGIVDQDRVKDCLQKPFDPLKLSGPINDAGGWPKIETNFISISNSLLMSCSGDYHTSSCQASANESDLDVPWEGPGWEPIARCTSPPDSSQSSSIKNLLPKTEIYLKIEIQTESAKQRSIYRVQQ